MPAHRMLKPYGALHGVTPLDVIARTCAYSEYGLPVIQGRAVGIETTGLRRFAVLQSMALSAKRLLVASSNSYRTAPRAGCQANAGVREKVWLADSSARRRKALTPATAVRLAAGAGLAPACAGPTRESTTRDATNESRTTIGV